MDREAAGDQGEEMIKSVAAALACGVCIVAMAAPAQAQTREYRIPAGSLKAALDAYARQSGRQIIYKVDEIRSARSSGARGNISAEAALAAVLAGTGFRAQGDSSGALAIVRTNIAGPASTEQTSTGEAAAGSAAAEIESVEEGEEIVVTGTNIRGGASTSPTIVIDREDIEKSGLATTQQLVDRLPQHFGGSVSENTVGSLTGGTGLNIAAGNGLDLRGLGTDSTLVLINGRRVASAGIGNFVDLSLIPLSAVARVEIVADGASAIYGSDAVGGVANFILLDEYEGAETRARFGTATDGDSKEYQFGQIFGTTWSSGSALFSYEFHRRDSLDANDRSFAAGTEDPFDLLPKQRRHSAFFTIKQDLSDSVGVFADIIYANRRTEQRLSFPGSTDVSGARTEQFGLTTGSRIAVGSEWEAELRGTYDQNETDQLNELASDFTGRSWAADAKINGPVFRIPGGGVQVAIGGQYRRETYDRARSGTSNVEEKRDIFAAFGEVLIPFVGDDNNAPGLRRLELTAAARVEHYSDFGTTINPKVGLLWSPARGLKVRGTYGTAFRAPLLFERDESGNLFFPFAAPDPSSPTGLTNTIIIVGGNAELEPEKAKTFSAGIDYSPPSLPSFDLSLTFFGVDFKDRIGDPPSDPFFLLGFEVEELGPFLTRNVDQAVIQEIATRPGFLNFDEIPIEEITAIGDFRTANLARTQVRGIDAAISYNFTAGLGHVDLGLDATYLIDHKTQLTPTVDLIERVDTRFNPIDLVATGSASWSHRGFTASAFVNYADSYKDNSSDADQVFDIDSWTTLDLALMYDTGRSPTRSALRNITFSLSAQNVFNTDPPFVRNLFGLNFDGANASPLGRFVSFQVTKKW